MSKLIEHHIHYKEIDGYDETVWMTVSEHKKLHHRLSKEGKCNVPSDKLAIIATNAHYRTPKFKEYLKKYFKNTKRTIHFSDTMMPNVIHDEHIQLNIKTGVITVSCYFKADHGKKIFYIDI